MSDILKKILSVKHEEVIDRKRRLPLAQLISAIEGMPKSQDFHLALKKKKRCVTSRGNRGDKKSITE